MGMELSIGRRTWTAIRWQASDCEPVEPSEALELRCLPGAVEEASPAPEPLKEKATEAAIGDLKGSIGLSGRA